MRRKHRIISLFAMMAITIFAAMPAFAGTTLTNGQGSVPVYLNQTATPIDVTIGTGIDPLPSTDPNHPGEVPIDADGDGTVDFYGPTSDAIYMYGKEDSNHADVTDLVVQNNMESNPVYVKGIIVNNVTSGYTLADYTDDYSAKQANSKEFGLAITKIGSAAALTTPVDLKTGYENTVGDAIAAATSATVSTSLVYKLDGKVAATTEAINLAKVADCVVTVAMTPGTAPVQP